MKMCESCRYRNNTEYEKPCIVYRDDCEFYEKERGDMTREEAIHKMEYSKRAYQMLIDEKVQEGVLVGQGINAEWSADTPIIDAYKDMLEACDMAIKALEQEPTSEMVHVETLRQVMWERDIAIGQLKELGYGFGQKIEPCGDLISRQAVISTIYDNQSDFKNDFAQGFFADRIRDLPPVNPQEPTDTWSIKDVADTLARHLPIVTPQPETGHWIQTNEFFINQDGQFIYKFICSECKSLSYFRKSNKKAIGANVCPNCGARMESEVTDADSD